MDGGDDTHISLREHLVGGATVIEASGELDLYAAPELKRMTSAAIDEGRTRIVVDLMKASFMDSTALGVLIGAVKRLRVRDGELAVASDQPSILRVLEITGLDQVLAVHPTRDAALAAVGGSPA